MRAWTLHEALIYGKGVERPFLCPVHGDSRPSASLNTVKQVWFCYTCGAKGGLTGEDALIEPDYEVMKKWFAEKMEENRVYPESWLSRFDAGPVHQYWTERVGDEAARHHRLGYDPERDAVTYPLRDEGGAVLGVVRRPFDPDGPKYVYPKGVDVGRLLFNYSPEHRPFVVLVEGALDAITLWNQGVTAFAIYGSHISPEQVRLIDRIDPDRIYTAYDNDDAGYKATYETERAFRHRMISELKWPRSWGKDVGELSETHLKKVLAPLASDDLACIESPSWRSPASAKRTERRTIRSSRSTSKPRRLRIVPTTT